MKHVLSGHEERKPARDRTPRGKNSQGWDPKTKERKKKERRKERKKERKKEQCQKQAQLGF